MVSQGQGGHEGFSGTPLWKIKEQYAAQREASMAESLAYVAARSKPIVPPNVLVDGICMGGAGAGKPYTRHALVKDLRKVADRSKVDFPMTGLFADKAPIGLYALFDGQSTASEVPGHLSAEYCAKNFHKKVMDNISSLPPNCTSETYVKAALVKSFEDLDKELIETQPDIQDGCGAAVGLLVGDMLFSAVLGLCDGLLYEVDGKVKPLGRTQGRPHLEEKSRMQRAGVTVIGNGPGSQIKTADGLTSFVTRGMGDVAWKKTSNGVPVLSCIPEIQSTKLSWAEKQKFFMLNSKPVAEAFTEQELVDTALAFPNQPRAAVGEVVTKAVERSAPTAQCTAVEIWLLAGGVLGMAEEVGAETKDEGPAKKKLKTGTDMTSARLRHIMLKFQDGPPRTPDGKKVRTKAEAETLMRKIMRDLNEEAKELKSKHRGRKPEDYALKSERFTKLCKEHSECPSAQKGGAMCGDLGWVSKEMQSKRGGNFRELVAAMRPGDYSDIVTSAEGLHLLQRIA